MRIVGCILFAVLWVVSIGGVLQVSASWIYVFVYTEICSWVLTPKVTWNLKFPKNAGSRVLTSRSTGLDWLELSQQRSCWHSSGGDLTNLSFVFSPAWGHYVISAHWQHRGHNISRQGKQLSLIYLLLARRARRKEKHRAQETSGFTTEITLPRPVQCSWSMS